MIKHKWLAMVLVIVLLTGCSDFVYTEDSDFNGKNKYIIGVIVKSMDNEYAYSIKSGIEAAADDYQVETILVYPKSEQEVEVQNEMIDNMLNSKIDALIVSPVDSSNAGFVGVAELRGIPVFTMDTELYRDDVPYIGADNYEIGRMAARHMEQLLNGKGEVAVLSGSYRSAPHLQRVQGFTSYMRNNTNIDVLYSRQAYSDFKIAASKTEEMFRFYPQIDGIFVTNATMALGIIDRINFLDLGRDIPIIGVDTQNDVLLKVIDGEMAAVISQDGYEIAHKAVGIAYDYLEGKDVPLSTIIKSDLITKDNIEDYLESNE